MDYDLIEETIDKINDKTKILIATSSTRLNKDLVFNFVDDIILTYITNRDNRTIKSIEKYEYLLEYITELSNGIINISNACIMEIWKKIGVYQEYKKLSK